MKNSIGLDGTILELIMKSHWYRLIESGAKKAEYRDIKPFWWTRIFTSPHKNPEWLSNGWYNGRHTYVRFRLGYASNAETMIFKLGRVGIGHAKPEWAEGQMGRMIVLELGERIN